MPTETAVSLNAEEFRRYPANQALAFVDTQLGSSDVWEPTLVAYRLKSRRQEDWKVEVGCWLLLAQELGFLPDLLNRIQRARKAPLQPHGVRANDVAHRLLLQELAPAMVLHYLAGCGWEFVGWNPTQLLVNVGDVDIRLRDPRGTLTDIQVKASDQPGELFNYIHRDGEYDSRVLAGIDNAMKQLANNTPGPQRMVVVTPIRTVPVEAAVLTSHLLGAPAPDHLGLLPPPCQRGKFARHPGNQVGAVVALMLDRFPGPDLEPQAAYRCTVLLNPWMDAERRPQASAFRGARVGSPSSDGSYVWTPERPR